ncbi:MAG: TetR/AcrR family transcriptional regulator [Candidatus Omnitrophica bacterium]|nr:TetR/AcrR family transcriptional regulator [Candidatus Omnitrophota bacterium]
MAAKKLKTGIRKAQITAAALEVIAENGLSGLTISAIAKKVGIANGNIYRHFKDKNSVIDEIISGIGASLERIIKDARLAHGSPLYCLEDIFLKHLEYLEKNKAIPKIVFSEQMYSAQTHFSKNLKNNISGYLLRIKEILRKGVEDKIFERSLDIESAAVAFVGLIQSTALQWVLSGYSFSPKSRSKKIWQIYSKGILSR